MSKPFKINPVNIFGTRRRDFPPVHFDYVNIDISYNLREAIERWIDHNCKSKYYIGKELELDNENKIITRYRIGFENPKELSYFMLACPHLKYN